MPKQILLVDDSVTIHKVVVITFAREDFAVTAVKSGDEGIARARELKPDVVLADAGLAGQAKSGYDVCAALRGDPSTAGVPCLILTGNFAPYDEAKGQKAGADGFVVKPFETQGLIDKVNDAINRRRSGAGTAVAAAAPPAAPPPSAPPPSIMPTMAMQAVSLPPPAPKPAPPPLVPPAPKPVEKPRDIEISVEADEPPPKPAPRPVSTLPPPPLVPLPPAAPPVKPVSPPAAPQAATMMMEAPKIPAPPPPLVPPKPVHPPAPPLGAPPMVAKPASPPAAPQASTMIMEAPKASPPAAPPPPPIMAPAPPPVVAKPSPTGQVKMQATMPAGLPTMPRASLIPNTPAPTPAAAPKAPEPASKVPRQTIMGMPVMTPPPVTTPPAPPKPQGWAPPRTTSTGMKAVDPATLEHKPEPGAPVAQIHKEMSPLITAVAEKAQAEVDREIAAAGGDPSAYKQLSREIIEKIAWEVVPELVEVLLKEQQAKK